MLGMHHAQVTSQCVVPAECLLLGAQRTVYFQLARVVDGVLVTREVVRPRENGVAGLAGGWVDAFTFVRPRLGVALRR